MPFEFRIATIFKELFEGFQKASLIGKALENGLVSMTFIDLRDFAHDRHRSLDDTPYGGGAGMVMMAGPVLEMLDTQSDAHRVLLSPRGRPFNQETARRLAERSPLLLFCGRYEGLDERACGAFDETCSIGDFVLNGGEVAAMAIVEAVSRLIPGVLGNAASPVEESFSIGLLEYPQYTRPEIVRGMAVPPVLLSGDHGKVARWRRAQALHTTSRVRPDLFDKLILSKEDAALLEDAEAEADARPLISEENRDT
jgi:tRNA (guanine37-N1)-methyltransferase